MDEITNRNYDIAAARLAGEGLKALSERYGLHVNSISRIAQDNAIYVRRRDGRRVPDKLTVRAAVTIEDAFGIWPIEADISYITERWYLVLRYPIRRVVLEDIRKWLNISR